MKKFMSEKGPVDSAILDGYHFGDRLLEGVHFVITIDDKGNFSAETHRDSKSYMDDLNEKKWLKSAAEYAEDNDLFIHPDFEKGVHDDVWIEDDEDLPDTSTQWNGTSGVPIRMSSFADVIGSIQFGKIK